MTNITWNTKANKDENVDNTIEVSGNHIYFYNGVDDKAALQVNKKLNDLTITLTGLARNNGFTKPVIHLHINSVGGLMRSGVSIMDTILRLKKDVDIYTHVEGIAASAATFITLVGTKRFITPHSRMLIHQLSAGTYGKYKEMKDDIKNYDFLMDMIKRFYSEYTHIELSELDQILDHDLYWDAETCLKNGLVDEIS